MPSKSFCVSVQSGQNFSFLVVVRMVIGSFIGLSLIISLHYILINNIHDVSQMSNELFEFSLNTEVFELTLSLLKAKKRPQYDALVQFFN